MHRILLMSIAAAAVIGSFTTGNAQSIGSGEDQEAIKQIITEMTDSFNKHDAKALTRMYMPDAEFVSVRGDSVKGAAKVEDLLGAFFATRAKAATLKTLNVHVRFIRPDVALVHVSNELSGLTTSSGQNLPAHEELSLRVFVKEKDSAWRIAAFQNTLVAPFESSTPQR